MKYYTCASKNKYQFDHLSQNLLPLHEGCGGYLCLILDAVIFYIHTLSTVRCLVFLTIFIFVF